MCIYHCLSSTLKQQNAAQRMQDSLMSNQTVNNAYTRWSSDIRYQTIAEYVPDHHTSCFTPQKWITSRNIVSVLCDQSTSASASGVACSGFSLATANNTEVQRYCNT